MSHLNSVQDFKDVYDNKHRYDKSQINVQKRTKTPSDKVLKKPTAISSIKD